MISQVRLGQEPGETLCAVPREDGEDLTLDSCGGVRAWSASIGSAPLTQYLHCYT